MNLKLRNFEEKDIRKFDYWFNICTDWQKWDAPWEWIGYEFNKEKQLKIRKLKTNYNPCFEFEIIYNNEHIGWTAAYYMTDDYKWNDLEKTDKIAIGIDIPDIKYRGNGIGQEVYKQYLEMFRTLGYKEIYTQTWSGNIPMINLALTMGYKEINRYKDLRNVEGKKYDALTFKINLDEDNTIIRKARKEDATELSYLKKQMWEETYRGLYPDSKIDNYDYERNIKKFEDFILEKEKNLYVVTKNKKIIAYMECGKPYRKYEDYKQEIGLLYILKEYQGNGLGRKLFNLGYDNIKSKGVDKFFISCFKYNDNAKNFYQKMGGKIVHIDEEFKREFDSNNLPQIKYEYKVSY